MNVSPTSVLSPRVTGHIINKEMVEKLLENSKYSHLHFSPKFWHLPARRHNPLEQFRQLQRRLKLKPRLLEIIHLEDWAELRMTWRWVLRKQGAGREVDWTGWGSCPVTRVCHHNVTYLISCWTNSVFLLINYRPLFRIICYVTSSRLLSFPEKYGK
jgi:hypothetical protein